MYQQCPYDSMQEELLQTAHPSMHACRMVEAKAALDKAAVHSADMQATQPLVEAAVVEAALPQPQEQLVSKAKKSVEGTPMSPSRLIPPGFPLPCLHSSFCTPLTQPRCDCPVCDPICTSMRMLPDDTAPATLHVPTACLQQHFDAMSCCDAHVL